MLRSTVSRRLAGAALALSAGTGIGLGAYTLGSSDPYAPPVPRAASASSAPSGGSGEPGAAGGTAGPASSPLTLDEAKAVAAEAAPGRVIEWDEDREATGLRYDVTLLHDDGTTTDVEVDTVTGQVTSIDHDDDRD